MKSSNISRAAGRVQQKYALVIRLANPCLVYAGILLFYTTRCFRLFATENATEIFPLELKRRGGEGAWVSFTVNTLWLWLVTKPNDVSHIIKRPSQ
jgi:hypothetical protein